VRAPTRRRRGRGRTRRGAGARPCRQRAPTARPGGRGPWTRRAPRSPHRVTACTPLQPSSVRRTPRNQWHRGLVVVAATGVVAEVGDEVDGGRRPIAVPAALSGSLDLTCSCSGSRACD
jgi:hypothetical protein